MIEGSCFLPRQCRCLLGQKYPADILYAPTEIQPGFLGLEPGMRVQTTAPLSVRLTVFVHMLGRLVVQAGHAHPPGDVFFINPELAQRFLHDFFLILVAHCYFSPLLGFTRPEPLGALNFIIPHLLYVHKRPPVLGGYALAP